MDVAAKLAEAQVFRVAIVDDDLSERITSADIEVAAAAVARLFNDPADPDREAYLALLQREGKDLAQIGDLAEPLAEETIRAAAPERIRRVAEAVLAARKERAEPVVRVIGLLKTLGIAAAAIDLYPTPDMPHDKIYDLIVVDYFLVDTATDRTLPFIREVLDTHQAQALPLQVILMSSHDEQLKTDFKTIRPALGVSSSRLRIMEKPKSDTHLVAWQAALYQLASDRADVIKLERFITETGVALTQASASTASKLWELDLQAMDLLHELAANDNDDYVRYVEDAISRRLLSGLEDGGGMRASLRELDISLSVHRPANLLAPPAEIGDSRAAIHSLMHSMEWRDGVVGLPAFPVDAPEMERAVWIRKYIRFGMVLRDSDGTDWLNITQACDLAQAKDEDIGQSTVLFVRGQRTLPAMSPHGDYYVAMSAMMVSSENHVLTWNLRDVRAESIQAYSTTYGRGWQVVGELRPDAAQNIAAKYGARMARVGLPVTMAAWRLTGQAVRVGDLHNAAVGAPLTGLALNGHAIKRASESKLHELHLDRASLFALLNLHGDAFDAAVVPLLTGLQLKPGALTDLGGKPVIAYCMAPPMHADGARAAVKNDAWLRGAANADKIVILLWCSP